MGKEGLFFLSFGSASPKANGEALSKGALVNTKVLMKESHVLHRSCSLCERSI